MPPGSDSACSQAADLLYVGRNARPVDCNLGEHALSILVVGTLAFDSVTTPFGERQDALGGSGSFLSTAGAFFGPVQLSSVIGDDFSADHLDFLRSRQVDTTGVQRMPGKTFRWRGHYANDLNTAHTLETQLNVLKTFEPRLPPSYRQARWVVLGNVDPRLQSAVLSQIDHPQLVACDTMNYWIRRSNAELRTTLKQVDLLLVNEAEARELSGEQNLLRAAAAIRKMGPRLVVIKRGEYGAMLIGDADTFAIPALPLLNLRDPTGAGDTFAGTMLGYLARQGRADPPTLRQAVVLGTVMASFVVEDFSLDRLRTLRQSEIIQRIDAIADLVGFDASSMRGALCAHGPISAAL
jgi:sugar/nucleoside kinase (ribokinase family)